MARSTSRFGLPTSACHLELQIDQRLNGLVSQFEGCDHHILGDLVGAAFDHQDGVRGAGDAQVEVGGFDLRQRSG